MDFESADVDEENSNMSNVPFDSKMLSDLFGFRCRCDLGYRPEAIVLIHSHPGNIYNRNAVRNTWGSLEQCKRYGVVLSFVMGRPRTKQEASLVTEEMEQHGDMMVGNFTWGTDYTTLQTFLALRWYRWFCPPTPFLVQALDFTFIRLNKLGDITNSFTEGENTMVGLRRSYIQVTYDYIGNVFLDAYALLNRYHFPPHCSLSAGFVMPMILALEDFSKICMQTNQISLIDICYGLAAEKHNWTVQHNDVFSDIKLKEADDACVMNSKFTALSPYRFSDIIYDIWNTIIDPNFENNCRSDDT